MKTIQSEAIENIRILLDKPPSPLVTNHIINLIAKKNVSNSKLIPLFFCKHRSDIILHILEQDNISIATINTLLLHLRKDILKYSQEDVRSIYRIVLKQKKLASLRKNWGLLELLQQAMKRTNQEAKDNLLWLIRANVQVLRQLGQSNAIQEFVNSYIQYYLKHIIYLGSFSALTLLCLKLDDSLPNSQLINTDTKRDIFQQTITLLQSSSRKEVYTFQNYSLKILTNILKQINKPIPDLKDMYCCDKILQLYIFKKATRQEARNTQHAYNLLKAKISQIGMRKQQKIQIQSQNDAKDSCSPIILIQNVIDRVNLYRQHKNPDYSKIAPIVNSNMKNNNMFTSKCQRAKLNVQRKKYSNIEKTIQNCLQQKELQQLKYKQQRDQEEFNSDMSNSISSKVEQFSQFVEVSSLIDLAYKYKFS